jgi:arsenite methyltransferase
MDFSGDIGLYQRRVAECPGGAAQRIAVLRSLSLEIGQAALDIGCGGGHLVREFAISVGSKGRAVGLDVSEEQLVSAREYCAEYKAAACILGNATEMDFEDASFDKLASIRTLEYIEDVPAALAEMRRVLKPGGVAALVSVLWDQFRFHGPASSLNERILEAFRAHCPHQMLPMALPVMLARSGFVGALQEPVTLFERSLNEYSYAFWVSKLVAAFAVGEGISSEDAELWLQQLQHADDEGRFGFVSVPVLTITNVSG